MFQSLRHFAERISHVIAERPFLSGFLLGLAVAAAILLVLFLVTLLFRPRKLRRIVVQSEGGELRIDAKAVQGAVKTLARKYTAFSIRKVGLYGKQPAFSLKIEADFNGGGASVSVLAAQFRAAIVQMMTDMLGTERPSKIEVEIRQSYADAPTLSFAGSSDDSDSD